MSGPALFRPGDISSGLVAWWKMNENSGQRNDSSGNGHHLTDNNTVQHEAQDYFGLGEGAAKAERANDEYFSVSDHDDFDTPTAWTFACWVKMNQMTAAAGNNIFIFGKRESASKNWSFRFTNSAGVVDHLAVFIDNQGSNGATDIEAGQWTHIAASFSETNQRVTFYINGNIDAVVEETETSLANTGDFLVMKKEAGDTARFDGLMKDAAYWNRELTPLEVKSLAMGVDLTTSSFRPSDVGTQPTSHWPLNEISHGGGAVTRSDSVGSNDLTDVNTVKTLAGFIDGAGADFEASSSEYLEITDGSQSGLDLNGVDFSICAWIKRESTGQQVICAKGVDASSGYMFRITGAHELDLTIAATQTKSAALLSDLDTWYHVAVTFDDATNTVKLYIDGKEVHSATNGGTLADVSNPFRVGSKSNTAAAHWDGIISDLALWNGYVLTPDEIRKLAQGFDWQRNGLVSYHKMEEGSGTRVDSFGSNDLTDNNTVGQDTGQVGEGADFEASNSEYLSLPNNDDIDITRDLTILMWVKRETAGATQRVFDKDAANDGYGLRLATGNQAGIVINNAETQSSTTLSASTWYHVAGVYTGAFRQIYVDSDKDGEDAYTTDPSDADSAIAVGAQTGGGGDHMDGLIDEVLLASRWFREEEIKAIYNRGLNGANAFDLVGSSDLATKGFFLAA